MYHLYLILSSVLSASPTPCSSIEALTDSNFDEVIASSDSVFVEFHAKWCAHCRKFSPRFDTVQELLSDYPKIKLATVDSDEFPDLAEKYEVTSYPTFKLFRQGEVIDYSSDRDEQNMADWIIKHSQPFIVRISSKDQLAELKSSHDVCFIMVGLETSHLFSKFLSAVKQSKGTCYGLIQEQDIFSYKSLSEAYIVMFKKFDNQFQIIIHFDNLEELFEKNRVPWVLPLADQSVKEIFEKGRTGFIYFSKNNETEVLRKLSERTLDSLQIAYGDSSLAQHSVLLKELGIENIEMPFGILVDKEMQKFLYKGGLDEAEIYQFYVDAAAGKIEKFFKTEKERKKEDLLTRFTRHDVPTLSKSTTIIAFTIPNCGYCRILLPELQTLAEKFRSLSFGYIDLSLNDVDIQISTFPTLALFSPSHPEGLFYSGPFLAAEIEEFYNLDSK